MKHVNEFNEPTNLIKESETDKYLSSQIDMLVKNIKKENPNLAKLLDLIRKEAKLEKNK
jgi:hypothetical protein